MSWICKNCETENPDSLKVCEVCDSPREKSPEDLLKEHLKEKYSELPYSSFIQDHYDLLNSADKGDASAQYKVGNWFYDCGLVANSDAYYKIAATWYKKAASKGHVDAEIKLASCYEEGKGVLQLKYEAIMWYRKAALVSGNEKAVKKFLKLKYDSKTYEKVIQYRASLLFTADNGNGNSQYQLGRWFSEHNSQCSYKAEAVVWFTKAAKNGHGDAMMKLGECYEDGVGLCKDVDEAFRWYEKAAKRGNKTACRKLAESYLYGKSVNKDVAKAIEWYHKAGGNTSAVDLCNIGYAYDVGDGISMNKTVAAEYYWKAAVKGDTVAQYNLGVCFENGSGVSTNLDAAKYWYEKAADQGYAQAQQCVSRINIIIQNQKRNKAIKQFVASLIFGPIYGGMGYYFLAVILPKWGIHIPYLGTNFYPTNLILCLVAGFVITYIIKKNNS